MRLIYINLLLLFLIISLTFPSRADDRPYKEYKTPITRSELFRLRLDEVLPPDAAKYIVDYRSCRHWRGEPVYSKERGEQIRRGIEESCPGLKDKRKSLHNKYIKGTREAEVINSIVREIEVGKSFPSFIREDPLRKSIVLNKYYEAHAQFVIRSVKQQLPEYQAILERLRNENETVEVTDLTIKELKIAKFKLEVQQRYLADIMKNIDRLHPITREQIERLEPKLLQALAVPD